MANQNNCATCCEYSQLNGNREKGHCYMFRDDLIDVCMQHTGRNAHASALVELAQQQAEAKRTCQTCGGQTCMFHGEDRRPVAGICWFPATGAGVKPNAQNRRAAFGPSATT